MSNPTSATKQTTQSAETLAEQVAEAIGKIPGVADVEIVMADDCIAILGFTRNGIPHSLSCNPTP